nr:general transcription factor 3C polypeptide 3-like isoform X3 [Quercus suber]
MEEVENGISELEEGLLAVSTKDNKKVDVEKEEEEEEEEEKEGEQQEEDDEDDDDGNEDENEGEGEYMFRFKDGINPFDFVEDNVDSGVQPYEQFERLEYEALAEKKRKLLANSHCEGSMKKARQEDTSGASMDEIMEAMNFGVRRKSRKPKKRGRRKGSKNKLSPEITRMLGDATLHYAHGHYEELYQKGGQLEHSIRILEDYVKGHPSEVDTSVIDLLASIFMESNSYDKALQLIEHAKLVYYSGKELPLNLTIKEGICHVNLKNMEKAEVLFSILQRESVNDHAHLIAEAADSLMSLEHYDSALKYYLMLEGSAKGDNGFLYLKIARCYLFLKERVQAIFFLYKALQMLEDNIDARLTLASLLLEEAKEEDAISLLAPPKNFDSIELPPEKSKPWWLNEKVKLKLCTIYRAKAMVEDFVDAIFPLVRESLYVETLHPKVKVKKRLSRRVLFERVKVLNDRETENVFRGFRPVAPSSDLSKAARAKRLLQKKATIREKKKAEALASGADWQSDDSDDDPPQEVHREPPLPNLLKDEEHHRLIIDLCKSLASLQRYWEALEIINLTLRLAHSMLSVEKEEELRSLGAQIAYNTTDPKHGFDCVRYIVQQHPYSLAAWNCYYKVISRVDNRDSRHFKFLRGMLSKLVDCVPPIIIYAHQFTMASNHQHAATKYLEAYKRLPENPLINLCVGTAMINLALGFRLQNKHQCLAQGLAFLYNNLRLCENSQEALYNIARAYHHVGLVTLATSYYEKVLAIRVKDYPIPKLPCENPDIVGNQKLGYKPRYCDLRREAAYNLHLIYKKSGALELARQVLKDHCTI